MAFPAWRIEIVKQNGMETWSNDWITDLVTIDDAADLGETLLEFERSIHNSLTQFLYIRVSSYVAGDRTFRHITTNLAGLINADDSLPLFCTTRIDLGTADSDPGRKYFRCPIKEAEQANGLLTPTYIAFLTGNINTLLVPSIELGVLCTPKGNVVTSASVFPRVQERQLHRRRKKKVTP